MKVYYVMSRWDACAYYRSLLPLIHNGWDGDKLSLFGVPKTKEEVAEAALRSDIVAFQRPDTELKTIVAAELRRRGKKIVLENDDTNFVDLESPWWVAKTSKDYGSFENKKSRINSIMYTFAAQADMVTVTTQHLANEYGRYNDNIEILPNYIDPDDFPDEIKRNETDKVRIGLIGSSVFYSDSSTIYWLLEELKNDKRVEVISFGMPSEVADHSNELRKMYKIDIEAIAKRTHFRQPMVQFWDYYETMNNLKLDMLLIPRKDNYFNRCKSNVKWLEASMLEIPVIAQGFESGDSPYQADFDGKNGRLVFTKDDWVRDVEMLIANKDLRRQIGKTAKQCVLDNYQIKDHAYKWKKAYEKIMPEFNPEGV